jgi:hypothetical protein
MNKKLSILIVLLLISIFGITYIIYVKPINIQAVGDLEITHDGASLGPPVFFVENMLPGDMDDQDINVTNNGTITRYISVKGNKTGGVGDLPHLEEVLEIVINENGGSILYGEGSLTGLKTVKDFFDDSFSENGILLSTVGPSTSATYNFKILFPSSAGNEYQEKSVIFELIFGYVTGDNIVINEVYYLVDDEHGLDCLKDREINAEISGNAAGSTNTILLQIRNTCLIKQSNNSNINNQVNISSDSGGNSASGNTGGNASIITGAIDAVANMFNFGNINVASCNSCCGKKKGQNDEWIELFNPTDQDVNLKNWLLEDNSGMDTRIRSRRIIKAGGFALISKSSRTWRFWDEDSRATKIRLGRQIGDGLDNAGDHLLLKNPDGELVDATAWGNDTTVWPIAVPLVSPGSSMERQAPGLDTDTPQDWEERIPPTPGF